MNVFFTRLASRELYRQIETVAANSDEAAKAARLRIERVLDRLVEFPESAPAAGRFRSARVEFGRYGFVLLYSIHPDGIWIERVLHGRQDR